MTMNFEFAGAPMSAARRVASQGRHRLGDVTHTLHDMSDEAMEAATRAYRRGSHALSHSARDFGHLVEEHPVRTTLFALGIGCLLAAMLIRR